MSNVRQHKVQVVVEPLDHSSTSVAQRIHAVQMDAYSQEAKLIGAIHFPPLSRTLKGLRSSPEQFFGAYAGGELVGAAGIEAGGQARVGISSFVVAPKFQRQGVGRAILHHIIELHGHQELQVQTAARNVPALALYRGGGFSEVLRWFVGAESLELVALRRSPQGAQSVA